MIVSPSPEPGISLALVEFALTVVAFAIAFVIPRLGSAWFSRIERTFSHLARKRGLAVIAVGVSTLLLRLAMLPLRPIPLPFLPDDFSFLFGANTFALGRLTNPTPGLWIHFETIHISMVPTYVSMYFPGPALILAAGKVLFGNPWFGLLIASALMCAAICWMLQAWLPPGWALLGGILAMLRLGLFSYWINTYTGGGLITALGGALVLGALPRLMKTVLLRDGLLMAIGMILLAFSRPYEGLLLCLPVAVLLIYWAFFGNNRPRPSVLIRRAAIPLVLVVAAGAWMGYYDYRAFGSPLTLPYTVNRAQYGMAPYYVWQSARPEPQYRHKSMRSFYYDVEFKPFEISKASGFLAESLGKVVSLLRFYAGFALLPPLIMLRRVLLDRRIRLLVLCLLVLMAGVSIEVFMIPHYVAGFTAAFYAIGLQAMRHLRLWTPEKKPVGLQLVRFSVLICVLLATARLFTVPLHLTVPEWPSAGWAAMWYGPDRYGTERAQIEASLESLPGAQLVLVEASDSRNALDQWVYNNPDLDHSKVVWANDMSAADNLQLIQYYRDRTVWLVEMDTLPATVSRYPVPPVGH